MSNENSAPVLIDCEFRENEAGIVRAGFHNAGLTPVQPPPGPSLTRCTFILNKPSANMDILGGGLYLDSSGYEATVTDCTFDENQAKDGGGFYINGPSATLTLCKFRDNTVAPISGTGNGGGGDHVLVPLGQRQRDRQPLRRWPTSQRLREP